jgi:uncharacterized membrane protein YidH (DUF202 family)
MSPAIVGVVMNPFRTTLIPAALSLITGVPLLAQQGPHPPREPRIMLRLTSMILLLLIGVPVAAAGQGRHERDREQIEQQKAERIDSAAIAGLKERVKRNEEDVATLKASLEKLRTELHDTSETANNNKDAIKTLVVFGKGIGGALLFVLGIVVTQLVTNFINRRKASSKNSRAMAAGKGS